MSRLPWIASILSIALLAGAAEAVPTSVGPINIDTTNPNPVATFDFNLPPALNPIPHDEILSVSLAVSGFGTTAGNITWALGSFFGFPYGVLGTEAVPVGAYAQTFTVFTPGDNTGFFNNLAQIEGLVEDGVVDLFATGPGGFNGTATLTLDTVNPIPEPSTMLLFLCGALGAGAAARKKRLALEADAV